MAARPRARPPSRVARRRSREPRRSERTQVHAVEHGGVLVASSDVACHIMRVMYMIIISTSAKERPLLTPSLTCFGASGSVRHSTGDGKFSAPPSGRAQGLPPISQPTHWACHPARGRRAGIPRHRDLVHRDLVHLDWVHRDLVHLEAARSPLGLPLLALLLGGGVGVRVRVGSGLG